MAKQTTIAELESRLSKLHHDYLAIKGRNTLLTARNTLLCRWVESHGGDVESIVDMSRDEPLPADDTADNLELF